MTADDDTERAKRLGAAIRRLRKAKGLTLEQVAEAIGTKHGPLSQYERGERNPSLPMLEKIAEALGVDPGAFWEPPAGFAFGISAFGVHGFGGSPDHDPTAPDPEPAEGAASPERRSGMLREYEIPNTVTGGGVVEGIVAGKGATNRVAALIEGIKHRKGDRSGDHEPIKRSLVGVPKDIDLVFVAARLEVRAADQIVRTIDKGKVLLVDTTAKPHSDQPDQAELVIAERTDPTPGDPTDDEPDPIPGRSRLMRYVVGPEGVEVLFPLDGSPAKAVTLAQGWRIVGVVIDDRWPQRGE